MILGIQYLTVEVSSYQVSYLKSIMSGYKYVLLRFV